MICIRAKKSESALMILIKSWLFLLRISEILIFLTWIRKSLSFRAMEKSRFGWCRLLVVGVLAEPSARWKLLRELRTLVRRFAGQVLWSSKTASWNPPAVQQAAVEGNRRPSHCLNLRRISQADFQKAACGACYSLQRQLDSEPAVVARVTTWSSFHGLSCGDSQSQCACFAREASSGLLLRAD